MIIKGLPLPTLASPLSVAALETNDMFFRPPFIPLLFIAALVATIISLAAVKRELTKPMMVAPQQWDQQK